MAGCVPSMTTSYSPPSLSRRELKTKLSSELESVPIFRNILPLLQAVVWLVAQDNNSSLLNCIFLSITRDISCLKPQLPPGVWITVALKLTFPPLAADRGTGSPVQPSKSSGHEANTALPIESKQRMDQKYSMHIMIRCV